MIKNTVRISDYKSVITDAKLFTIYQILNLIDGKFYIGSAYDYKNRWSGHIHLLNKNKHHNIHLQRAWNKYGSQNFMFSIMVQVFNEIDLLKTEQYNLDFYFKYFPDKLYNLAKIVEGHSNGLDMRGENNTNAKLTKNQVIEIRKNFFIGSTNRKNIYFDLSKKYNVSELTISRIIRNKSWTNI